MRAVLISVSNALSQQCAADTSPAIWDHTCHPIQMILSLPYIWKEIQTSHITAITFLVVKPIPICTAW